MKNLAVFFSIVASILLLAVSVSAIVINGNLASSIDIEVDGESVYDSIGPINAANPAVIAGDVIAVKTSFIADKDDTDVRVELEIEGEKDEYRVVSESFDVEEGQKYSKTLLIKVPSELKDDVSDYVFLSVEIDGKEYKSSSVYDISLRVQRPSYYPVFKSISVSQSIKAGETFPVDVVLKNMGYNDLDDVYVTAKISELGIEKSSYFGDLVNLEDCDDDDCNKDDTVSGRLYLEVPYGVSEGAYTLEVEVSSEDTVFSELKSIVIENDFANNIIVTNTHQSIKAGEDAIYNLLIVNPTNSLKVYRVVTESDGAVSSSASATIVAVPAGSSKTISVTANAESEGDYTFNVNVFSGEDLVSTVALSMSAEDKSVTSPMVVLTVILAIVFLVLLVVLIVLIGKKPEKSDEFGESYY